ncbi:MAG: coproporphyrinogen dehydrogenase HemZ [Oscillospiraceae bacterium]|jgi:oxygen-independent coproporphyrinogen-3 oxidase|nr:coproporphyrinogen dehydrogenase HemZ [Oscillospiraceae bacterium]
MRLIGHSHRYAVEQTALSLFGTHDIDATSELRGGVAFATVNGLSASRRVDAPFDTRAERYALKVALYLAALPQLQEPPPWGAVSGVKPTQLAIQGADLVRDYFVTPERAALAESTARYARTVADGIPHGGVMLYAAIPFCPSRCAYCSFVSNSTERHAHLVSPYLDALEREIDFVSAQVASRGERVAAVYIGGGTPTTLSAEQLRRLITRLRERFALPDGAEFTVEAGRPDTITPERLDALQECGVTRISVNPQTMSDRVLANIGRRHSAQDAVDAFNQARERGFECVNMDLIAGLPGDDLEGFKRSVDVVLALEPENVTLHTLTRKRGSDWNAERVPTPGGSEVGAMLDYAFSRLRNCGLEPYYLYRQKYSAGGFENSGWTRKGFECRYNVAMMEELCSVYALGAGGATKLVTPGGARRITRSFNKKYPAEYIADFAAP